MAMSGGKDDGSPMMEMNTTPLIDVMLVLLIMFIITIPVATHSLDIDLPPPAPPNSTPPVNPVRNKLVITVDGKLAWNTGEIDGSQLVTLLAQTRAMDPEPELQFQPESEASYDLTSKVINIIKQSKVTKFGFFGNEAYSEFSKSPNAGKTP
ncbi:MAG: biopolymer transporter ExbD [Novosphingobium sp.]